MRRLRRWLEEVGEHPEHAVEVERPWLPGLAVGIGAGVGIGAAVWRTFITMSPNDTGMVLGLAGGLGLLAFICTAAGTWAAQRARSGGRAFIWTFTSNVLPPTLLCLPTVIGLFFSVPAGLLAFTFVMPLVVLTRRYARADRPGWAERERLFGAAFVLLSGALMVALQGALDSHETGVLDFLPVWLTAFTAGFLVLWAFACDLRRAAVLILAHAGRLPGWRTRDGVHSHNVTLTRHATPGAGSYRAAETSEDVGAIAWPWTRMVAAAVLFFFAGVVPVAFTFVVVGPLP